MPTPTDTPKPEIQQHANGRMYRLYTVENLPFDALPQPNEGGPSMVTGGWSVSYQKGYDQDWNRIDGWLLNARVINGVADIRPHALDKTQYPTCEDACRAAYEAGLLAFMVYERDAGKFGLA